MVYIQVLSSAFMAAQTAFTSTIPRRRRAGNRLRSSTTIKDYGGECTLHDLLISSTGDAHAEGSRGVNSTGKPALKRLTCPGSAGTVFMPQLVYAGP